MSRMISEPSGSRVVFLLLIFLILTLGWASVAQAQGVAENEYGDPSPIPTASSSASDSSATSSASASGITGVLPSTGGATLFTLGAGVLLVGTGLVARRMSSK